MAYQKNVESGYIVSLTSGVSNGNITEEEYNTILDAIRAKPTAEQGYEYRLRENLSWELYKLPDPAPEDEDATEETYLSVLADLGVK